MTKTFFTATDFAAVHALAGAPAPLTSAKHAAHAALFAEIETLRAAHAEAPGAILKGHLERKEAALFKTDVSRMFALYVACAADHISALWKYNRYTIDTLAAQVAAELASTMPAGWDAYAIQCEIENYRDAVAAAG